jgi:hypothetical protein
MILSVGYCVNEQSNSLENTVTLLINVLENKSLNNDEATGLLKVVTDYAYTLDILDKYDHQELIIEGTTIEETFIVDYAEAKQAVWANWSFGIVP